MNRNCQILMRSGSVYIPVLGTALVVSVLALSSMSLQRIQNRMQLASGDMRQAQLNAESALELGLLTIRRDPNWRANHGSATRWFTDRQAGTGTFSLEVVDPVDGIVTNNPNDPIVMTGIGVSGDAEQRVEVTIDLHKGPLGALGASVFAADSIGLTNATLRTPANATVSANVISSTFSTVYGNVEAVDVQGITYVDSHKEIEADERPTMPDWATVFDYYQSNGTVINVNDLPTSTPNLGRNVSIESGIIGWTAAPPGMPVATIEHETTKAKSGSASLYVKSRSSWRSGAAQRIDDIVKPGQSYTIRAWVNLQSSPIQQFRMHLYTKGSGSAQFTSSQPPTLGFLNQWRLMSATLTARAWTGDLEYAFVFITGATPANTKDFLLDDFDIREATTGRFIYRKVLGPGVNPFGGATNPQGIYCIDCGGVNDLIIERSRIRGTLLVKNPGGGSRIGNGPINWSPAVPGYPALMVLEDVSATAKFTIAATNRALSETENGMNFNPAGATHKQFGTDADVNDIYPSEIRGLVVVRNDLTFENNATIRGQVIAGDDIAAAGTTFEVDYQQDSLLNPPPGFTVPAVEIRPGSVRKTVLP